MDKSAKKSLWNYAALRDRAVRVDREVEVVRRLLALRGLPPSMPFMREDRALRFDRTDPRHAGQKETRSILWI
jgi:hypothetical protein